MTDPRVRNPYAGTPRALPSRPIFPRARLLRLGADEYMLASLGASWDKWNAEERRAFVEEMSVLTDQELAARLHGQDE